MIIFFKSSLSDKWFLTLFFNRQPRVTDFLKTRIQWKIKHTLVHQPSNSTTICVIYAKNGRESNCFTTANFVTRNFVTLEKNWKNLSGRNSCVAKFLSAVLEPLKTVSASGVPRVCANNQQLSRLRLLRLPR